MKLVATLANPRAHHCAECSYVAMELCHTRDPLALCILTVLLIVVLVALFSGHSEAGH